MVRPCESGLSFAPYFFVLLPRFAAGGRPTRGVTMRGCYPAILLALWACPVFADDIGGVRAKPPEFTADVPMNLFDVERRIIDTDNIGKPWVYRQPDRPEDVMLVWESSDFGDATVLEMHGL